MAQVTAPRSKRRQIIMRPETVYGVDPMLGTYLAADVILADPMSIRLSQNIEEIMTLATAGALGRMPSSIGIRTARLSFDMELAARRQAYSASIKPFVDLPLRGCGLAATVLATTGTEKVTYQPSDTHEAMTIYVTFPIPGSATGAALRLVGCHGTPTFRGTAGGPMIATFEYEGVIDGWQDVTLVAGVLPTNYKPPTLKSAAFQIGATNYTSRIADVVFAMGNTLTRVPDISSASGLVGFMITDREPSLEINPEVDLETNSSWWAALQDGDPLLDCTFNLGNTQYDRWRFQFAAGGTLAGIQVVGQEPVDRDGLSAFRTTLRPTISNGANSDFALVAD